MTDILNTQEPTFLVGFNRSELSYVMNRLEAVNAAAHLGKHEMQKLAQHDPKYRAKTAMLDQFESDIIASGAVLNKLNKIVGQPPHDYSQGPRQKP
jgi:hypothetical protein